MVLKHLFKFIILIFAVLNSSLLFSQAITHEEIMGTNLKILNQFNYPKCNDCEIMMIGDDIIGNGVSLHPIEKVPPAFILRDQVITEQELELYSKSQNTEDLVNKMQQNSSRCLGGESELQGICEKQQPTNKKGTSDLTGYCYRYVKLGLKGVGLVDEYLGGASAKDAGKFLIEEGFINLLEFEHNDNKLLTPENAPVGSVIVYKGGKHGHIEVKTKSNEYISDYIGSKPIYDELGLPRTPIGIYIKPMKVEK